MSPNVKPTPSAIIEIMYATATMTHPYPPSGASAIFFSGMFLTALSLIYSWLVHTILYLISHIT